MKEYLFRAKAKESGDVVVGYYFAMQHNDEREHNHHFIIPLDLDVSLGTPIDKIQVEIDPNTLCESTGYTDKKGNVIFANAIVDYDEAGISIKNGCLKFDEIDMCFVIEELHTSEILMRAPDCDKIILTGKYLYDLKDEELETTSEYDNDDAMVWDPINYETEDTYGAVDKDGKETLFRGKPVREDDTWSNTIIGVDEDGYVESVDCMDCVNIPKGTIEKIIGKAITWEDEPVKLNI